MNTKGMSQVIPVSPLSTLDINQLESLKGAALNELEMKGQDVDSLFSSFKSAEDGGNPHSGEIAERSSQCQDPTVSMLRSDPVCESVTKLRDMVIRINEGKYNNHCTGCGEEVPFERLMRIPETSRCIPCKENG